MKTRTGRRVWRGHELRPLAPPPPARSGPSPRCPAEAWAGASRWGSEQGETPAWRRDPVRGTAPAAVTLGECRPRPPAALARGSPRCGTGKSGTLVMFRQGTENMAGSRLPREDIGVHLTWSLAVGGCWVESAAQDPTVKALVPRPFLMVPERLPAAPHRALTPHDIQSRATGAGRGGRRELFFRQGGDVSLWGLRVDATWAGMEPRGHLRPRERLGEGAVG